MTNTAFQGEFIEQAEKIILENISNEQFGVSELAEMMNMSRSNLLRKIKKDTQLSASQFIRQVRLQKSMEMIKQTSMTVSEVSYQVGFGSTSYFIKCFREYYGYPPGEVGKGIIKDEKPDIQVKAQKRYRWQVILALIFILIVVLVLLLRKEPEVSAKLEKSIAVLPFKNESSDSLNLYFVNGLMESSLNNLQKIGDLRVVSRTSVEKYRNSNMSIPEIAEELKVNYLVEGSGQRIGDQVLLNVQLIEASSDRPIWVEQYSREVRDVFELQNEVAKKIADAIEVVITPAELEQIEKKPTENLLAYDYYLQGLEPFFTRTNEGLEKAIVLFEKAIEQDPEFAMAYANIAISYYLLEMFQKDKQYTEKINSYSDQALLYDSKSDQSLIAKAFYYIQTKEYDLALPHLQKALEYNPNSSLAIQMLADFYFRMIPDSDKYLEYALRGIQLDIDANDSITQSYFYLQLSNALLSSGFRDEALKYVDKSLDFNADNYYAPLLKAFVLYAKDGNNKRTRNLLITEWHKDTTRLDILQNIAKMYYGQEKYDSAYYYFEKFTKARDTNGFDIYQEENVKIADVYRKMGFNTEAQRFFNEYLIYCEEDQSSSKSINLVYKFAYEGETDQAIEQLKIFSDNDNFQYWFILLEDDPMLTSLKKHEEFESIMQKIKNRFWENQKKLKKTLEDKGLM